MPLEKLYQIVSKLFSVQGLKIFQPPMIALSDDGRD